MGCTSNHSTNSKVFSDLRLNPILAPFGILHMMRIHSVSRICPLVTSLRLIYKPTWRWHTSPNQLFPKQRRCICFSACKVLLEAQKDVHSFHGTQGRPGCAPTGVNQHQCYLASKTGPYQKIISSGYYNIFWVFLQLLSYFSLWRRTKLQVFWWTLVRLKVVCLCPLDLMLILAVLSLNHLHISPVLKHIWLLLLQYATDSHIWHDTHILIGKYGDGELNWLS